MILEIVAALVVGVIALGLVLEPLLRRVRGGPALDLDQPDPEDTPRGIALSALKEIEFDKATGKLSDADYSMLKDRYTTVALEAMRAEDQASAARVSPMMQPKASDPVEAIIAAKVRALRSASASNESDAPVCPDCGPRPEPDAIFCSTCGRRLPTGVACGGCGAPLPPDGKFCEACGRKVAA
jgi:hypothetical protein